MVRKRCLICNNLKTRFLAGFFYPLFTLYSIQNKIMPQNNMWLYYFNAIDSHREDNNILIKIYEARPKIMGNRFWGRWHLPWYKMASKRLIIINAKHHVKKYLQVIGLIYSLFFVFSFCHAGTMGKVCNPILTTVPCKATLWDIGIDALYLSPIYNQSTDIYNNPITIMQDLHNSWDWGYRIEGSYHFATGNDFNLNWSHLRDATNNNTNTIQTSNGNHNVDNSTNSHFDQVNAILEQHVSFTERDDTQFYAGFQYAHIRASNQFNYNYNQVDGSNIDEHFIHEIIKTNFNGVGPTMGINFIYSIMSGLNVTANSSASITYGSTHLTYNATDFRTPIVGAGTVRTIAESYSASTHIIVPSLETKLGLNYAYLLWRGTLTIDGGYQTINYFNALSEYTVTNSSIRKLYFADFGLFGPYFGIHWLGPV